LKLNAQSDSYSGVFPSYVSANCNTVYVHLIDPRGVHTPASAVYHFSLGLRRIFP